jgi:signal transduction histidine kinase
VAASVVRHVVHALDDRGDGAETARSPFRREGLAWRVAPFAVVAGLAQASVVLPPGPQSGIGLAVSLALLAGVVVAFWLPWREPPRWTTVLVPIAYTGSVVSLSLSISQVFSGIGIVILLPVLWTSLFHRKWESLCVVTAVVVAEIVTSFTSAGPAGSVDVRRVVFWALMSILLSVSVHGLRDGAARSRAEAARLSDRLSSVAVLDDRDRIARRLHESTLRRLTAVELYLAGTLRHSRQPEVVDRLGKSLDDLDETIGDLRQAIFDLDREAAPAGAYVPPPDEAG